MADRKVLNKYYPPDFDPSLIPRRKGLAPAGTRQYKVRLMAPFSMQCLSCRGYIYKGTKFNARKEDAKGEKYLSIQIYRFYIRCPRCSAEIAFKTDPKNLDYTCEAGATRNFTAWTEDLDDAEKKERKRQEMEEGLRGKMGELEDRVEASRREAEIAEALDEIRTRNALSERVGVDEVMRRVLGEEVLSEEAALAVAEEMEAERRDEEMAREVFKDQDTVTLDAGIREAKARLGIAPSVSLVATSAVSAVNDATRAGATKGNAAGTGDKGVLAARLGIMRKSAKQVQLVSTNDRPGDAIGSEHASQLATPATPAVSLLNGSYGSDDSN